MLQEVSLRGRGSTLHKRFSVWSLMGWSMLNSETVSSCFLILLSFINTFYIFTWTQIFSSYLWKQKCADFSLTVIRLLCLLHEWLWHNSPVGWGSGCDSVFFLSQWLGAPSCQRGSYAFYKSVSSRAQPDGPVQVWKLGEFYFIRCGPQDPACIAEVRKLQTENVSWARCLGFWRETGPCPEGGRWRRLRGVEEDSKQGEELKLFPVAVWKYK